MRDKSVRQRHPRLFAGAIKEVSGKPKDGDAVDVFDNKGEWLARGVINQQSPTAVRLLTWDEGEAIDDDFWQRRVERAFERRARDPLLTDTNARRLIFGESDGVPGLVADDYAGHVVAHFSTLVALRAQHVLLDAIERIASARSVTALPDDERLRHERIQFDPRAMLNSRGAPPASPVEIHENGLRFWVDVVGGQKTGFYLDQRQNRARLARYCRDADVLNVFAYTGAFAASAAVGGSRRVVNVDSSGDALRLARRNLSRETNPNIAESARFEYVEADAFDDLRARRSAGESFDVVILDPPKFALSTDQIERASRAYKDLNRVGMSLVRPGGVLATFSCSGVVDAKLFQQIAFSAAVEAKRDALVVEKLGQASDHPVLLTFPESEYLKGLILRVT